MANHAPHVASRQSIAIIGNQRDFPRFQPRATSLVVPEDLRIISSAPVLPTSSIRGNVCLGRYPAIPNHFEPSNCRRLVWLRSIRIYLEAIEQHRDQQIVIGLCHRFRFPPGLGRFDPGHEISRTLSV
jgi:hypothetical protein